MKVGFIGLGVMGRPMALHLQRAGHDLHVWARRSASVAGLPATICATPSELGRCCEVVFTVITSSADVEAVALGADGLSEGMAPGSVLVDCSTIAPDVARHIAAQLGEKGIAMLDAPVSGGAQGAIDATLAIMAGGEADVLARGKGTSVQGVAQAGIADSGGGKVRLLRWADYQTGWDPKLDARNPVWEATHHLIRALNTQGEAAAGALLAAMPDKAEPIRQLAYHLYTLCERKKWAEDARAYNELITAWHAVLEASREQGPRGEQLGFEA